MSEAQITKDGLDQANNNQMLDFEANLPNMQRLIFEQDLASNALVNSREMLCKLL